MLPYKAVTEWFDVRGKDVKHLQISTQMNPFREILVQV